jgi:hypothetical protein
VLRSLTFEWKWKATTIEEAKDLNTYTLDELIENLQSYEVQPL